MLKNLPVGINREISASGGVQVQAKFKSKVMNSSRKAHVLEDHSGQVEEMFVNTVKP